MRKPILRHSSKKAQYWVQYQLRESATWFHYAMPYGSLVEAIEPANLLWGLKLGRLPVTAVRIEVQKTSTDIYEVPCPSSKQPSKQSSSPAASQS